MDELPQALAEALEETSPLVELDNDCQTSAFNSPKLTRRQSRKRRGRKRRADPNPIWEHAIKFSDGSDTSLDEALKDYMENVTSQAQFQNDSASDDMMVVRRLSSLNVTSSSNLYGESDSVTETHTILKRSHRRKKRFKRMAVDATSPSAITDFIQEGRQKRPKLKKVKKKRTDGDDIENSQNMKNGRFGFDITSLKKKASCGKPSLPASVRRKDSSPQSPGSGSSHRDSNPQSPHAVTEEGVMEDLSKKGTCSHEDGSRKNSGGSDAASETTLGGKAMECCTSNESDVTMEATPQGGNETSSLSSSSEEDGTYTNDEGREGDDEQSDFFFEPGGGAVCGIPGVIPWWERNTIPSVEDERFTSILSGTFSLLSRGSQRSLQSRLRGLQNMEDVQIRGCRARMKAKQRLKKSSMSLVNDKIVRFMKNPHERELLLQPMKKQEQTQLCQLASLYSLDMRTEGSGRKRAPVLIKTRESRPLIPMDIDRWSSNKSDWFAASQPPYPPQFADAKRRRKTPPPTIPLEGLVGPSKPIPDSNIGNRMLQSMGWSPGTGLGPSGSGIQEPIKTYIRPKKSGLGHWKPTLGQH